MPILWNNFKFNHSHQQILAKSAKNTKKKKDRKIVKGKQNLNIFRFRIVKSTLEEYDSSFNL